MENWIIMICLIYSKLEKLVDRYDDRIMKLALRPTGNCAFDYSRVTEAMNCKNMLINLKILYEHIHEAIGEECVEAIKHVVTRERIRKYCEENDVNTIEMSRMVKSAFSKAKEVLLKLSYNQSKFKRDYENVLEVITLYGKINETDWQRRISAVRKIKSTKDVWLSSVINSENGAVFASTH